MHRLLRPLALAPVLAGAVAGQVTPDALAHLHPGTTSLSRTVAPNGVRILTLPDDGDDRFELVALIDAGSRQDAPEPRGIAHFVARSLLRSTRRTTTAVMRHQLRVRGAACDAEATHDLTTVRIGVSPEHWRFAVQWLGEVLAQPAFEPEEIEATRRSILKSFDETNGTAARRAREALLYPGHALGRATSGTPEGIQAITRVHLQRFHAGHYRGGSVLVAFSGRVPLEDCRQELVVALAGLPAGGSGRRDPPPVPLRGTAIDPPRLPGTVFVRVETGYHLAASGPDDVVDQLVLAHYLRLRLAEVRDEADQAARYEVALDRHGDLQRLSLAALLPHEAPRAPTVDHLSACAREAGEPRARHFAAARDAAARSLWVASRGDLVTAAGICWLYERLGGRADGLGAQIAAAPPDRVGAYAAANLTPSNGYVLLPSPPPAGSLLLPILLVVLAAVFVFDTLRGFPIAHGVAALLRNRRARHEEAAEAAALRSTRAADVLVESIQDYLAEEQRKEG